jgi:RHS repeat-associated protein
LFSGKERDAETGFYDFGARYYNPKYSRWISADPALDEYLPVAPVSDEALRYNQNLPGMGGVFSPINLNLYAYAASNPLKYIDPSGAVILGFDINYLMQGSAWEGDKLGNSVNGEKIRTSGCAVTSMASTISTLNHAVGNEERVTPKMLNENKENFDGSGIKWDKVAIDYGLKREAVYKNLLDKIVSLMDSKEKYVVIAQVKYNADGNTHFLGVNGIKVIDRKIYLSIAPSSESDLIKSNRPRDTWKEIDGNMYVDISDVLYLEVYSIAKEANKPKE